MMDQSQLPISMGWKPSRGKGLGLISLKLGIVVRAPTQANR